MGRVLGRLESLDRALQERAPHVLLGTASLHASAVGGGRELSSYPDRCVLQLERRTLPGEAADVALREVNGIIEACRREDAEFDAAARPIFGRDGYAIDPSHSLPDLLEVAAASAGCTPNRVGMTFWSDAAILAAAGIPTVLFGPGGAGLHGVEEYVHLREVVMCRDALVTLARAFAAGAYSGAHLSC
jgi:acetylornithine deacetylase